MTSFLVASCWILFSSTIFGFGVASNAEEKEEQHPLLMLPFHTDPAWKTVGLETHQPGRHIESFP